MILGIVLVQCAIYICHHIVCGVFVLLVVYHILLRLHAQHAGYEQCYGHEAALPEGVGVAGVAGRGVGYGVVGVSRCSFHHVVFLFYRLFSLRTYACARFILQS